MPHRRCREPSLNPESARRLSSIYIPWENRSRVEIVDGVIKRAVYPEDEIDDEAFYPFWSHLPDVNTSQTGKSELTELYQHYLQDSTVIISIEAAAAGVYVSGEVLRPGKIPLDRPMTALEAVMECGGFTKFANPKKVIVVRNIGGKNQRYVLNMNEALYGSDSSSFYVRTYDVIYVRQSNW